jgi:hypothetical protein
MFSSEWYPVILVVVLWLSGILLRYLNSQDPDAAEEYDLLTWSGILVGAAEQLYEGNEAKFQYVMTNLGRKFPDLDANDLLAALEWAVHSLKIPPDERVARLSGPQATLEQDTGLLG